ncbi:hypothetical protein [Streptomyces tsukubensis]|uniref:hypothetical protein n=1 Tax=Streptomyces tsukubensis TaxID=83656 RepID=UPI00344C1239
MTTADQSLVKIYSDRTYTHTTMVGHQSTVIAFAIDDRRRIVYSVLGRSSYDEKKGELDIANWAESPAELPFPSEVVKVGDAVVGATAMPVVKKGGRAEAGPTDILAPEETDPFLPSTARLTAPGASFQVISDGSHVVVLPQAVAADHADADLIATPVRLGVGDGGGQTAVVLRHLIRVAGSVREGASPPPRC